jgi:hypothetical protein
MRTYIVGLLALTLSGCASIFSGSLQPVRVQAQYPDAQLFVDGRPVGSGTQVVSLKREKMHLVTAQKAGCKDGVASVSQNLNGVTALNILWLPFFWVGVIVDVATGALWDLEETVYVAVDCRAPATDVNHTTTAPPVDPWKAPPSAASPPPKPDPPRKEPTPPEAQPPI